MTGAGAAGDAGEKQDARSAVLRPNADVVAQRFEDSLVLVHLRTNRIHELNRTGARFWELLEEGGDRAGIEERLLAEFDVPKAQLSQELDELVERLAAEDLVQVADNG
jgi:Coenzyme PQQ synthesis protein D (PqqD)